MSTGPIKELIEGIASTFEEYKKVNDDRLEAESKGNEARAKELTEKLDRMERDLVSQEKARKEAERKYSIQQERLEILESVNDRPGKTAADKVKDEYSEGFYKWIRSGGTDQEAKTEMKAAQQKAREYKDVQIGSNADGGFAVPEEISGTVDKLMLRMSDILGEVKNVTVGTSDYKELLTINGSTSGWVGETGSRSGTVEPTLRSVAPTWGELYAYPSATEWSLQDVFFNVQSWLTENIAENMAKALDLAIWSGNGSDKPTGITANAPVSTADTASPIRAANVFQYVATDTTSPQAVHADDIIDLTYTLNRAYRGNAKFACNTLTQGAIRKLKDTTGQYLWQVSLQAGQPDLLLGKPVVTWEDMADPTTADGFYLGYGDFRKAYTLCSRVGLAITVDANITTPGYVKFYVRRRYGGIPANNDALKLLKLADS